MNLMTADREMRDRVAEALYRCERRRWGWKVMPWTRVPDQAKQSWRRVASDLIADFASLGLTLTTQDEPHEH